ncbi:hypothetical protein Bca4012_010531 [Brassica carinata]
MLGVNDPANFALLQQAEESCYGQQDHIFIPLYGVIISTSIRSLGGHKGKGILYNDDDAPIKLTDQDDTQLNNEFSLTLIEDDLKSVLRQGPFHFNFCMFLLVRWEPIVHDDYPWIIPFWVRVIGVPLHLWTVENLKNIGGRLGHVDTLELSEGRMLIDVDTRRPLKFSRKVESPDGDEVTIEIKYDMLFKHCSTCGMLTHEKEYCPSLDVTSRQSRTERPGVFTRVQLPEVQSQQQFLIRDHRVNSQRSWQSMLPRNDLDTRYSTSARHGNNDRKYGSDYSYSHEYQSSHKDRIMRRRDDYSRSNRYGGSRAFRGPYDRHQELTWKAKAVNNNNGVNLRKDSDYLREKQLSSHSDAVPYEHASGSRKNDLQVHENVSSGENRNARRLASTIVTPFRVDHVMEENVSRRTKGITRSLSFSTLNEQACSFVAGEDQIIGALDEMEIEDQQDGGMMDRDVQDDDLLGLELKEMEEDAAQQVAKKDRALDADKVVKNTRHGSRAGVPLGLHNKNFEILHRGSSRKPITSSHGAHIAAESGKLRHRTHSSKKHRVDSSKDVLKQVESTFFGLTFGRSDFPFLDLFGIIAVTTREGLVSLSPWFFKCSDKSCGVGVRSGGYRVWRAMDSNDIFPIIGLPWF